MKTKAGVVSFYPHPSILHAMEVADLVWRAQFGRQALVTSIRDSTHSERSLHYGVPGDARERAFDLRTNDLTPDERVLAKRALARLLGEAFDVVLEQDHLHVEYDPKV